MRNKMYIYLFGIFACSALYAMEAPQWAQPSQSSQCGHQNWFGVEQQRFLGKIIQFIASVNSLHTIKGDTPILGGKAHARHCLYGALLLELNRFTWGKPAWLRIYLDAPYDDCGRTPLMIVLDEDHNNSVLDLAAHLAHGANLHSKDYQNISVIDRLKRADKKEAFIKIFNSHEIDRKYYNDALELMEIHKLDDLQFAQSWVSVASLDQLSTLIADAASRQAAAERESTPQS